MLRFLTAFAIVTFSAFAFAYGPSKELHIPSGPSLAQHPIDDHPIKEYPAMQISIFTALRLKSVLGSGGNEVPYGYTISYRETDDEQILDFDGELMPLMSMEKFDAAVSQLRKGKTVHVIISGSRGGSNSHFAHFGRLIQNICRGEDPAKCHVITEVQSDCSSACVQFFMDGQVRISEPFSLFGFHATHIVGTPLKFPGIADGELTSRGANPAWIRAHAAIFRSTDPIELRAGELEGSNIITDYRQPNKDLVPAGHY